MSPPRQRRVHSCAWPVCPRWKRARPSAKAPRSPLRSHWGERLHGRRPRLAAMRAICGIAWAFRLVPGPRSRCRPRRRSPPSRRRCRLDQPHLLVADAEALATPAGIVPTTFGALDEPLKGADLPLLQIEQDRALPAVDVGVIAMNLPRYPPFLAGLLIFTPSAPNSASVRVAVGPASTGEITTRCRRRWRRARGTDREPARAAGGSRDRVPGRAFEAAAGSRRGREAHREARWNRGRAPIRDPQRHARRPSCARREPLGAGPTSYGHAGPAAEILPFEGGLVAEERDQLRLLPVAQLGAAREGARALGRHVALLDPVRSARRLDEALNESERGEAQAHPPAVAALEQTAPGIVGARAVGLRSREAAAPMASNRNGIEREAPRSHLARPSRAAARCHARLTIATAAASDPRLDEMAVP